MGTALRVAKEVGIDKTAVWAGVSPQGKKELIQRMQEEGEVVAMVYFTRVTSNFRLVMESTILQHLPLQHSALRLVPEPTWLWKQPTLFSCVKRPH
jgi:hypothetical protein